MPADLHNITVDKTHAAHLQILALQLSHNCPAACRPCVYECRPNRSRVMSGEEARRIIDQVGELDLTKNIGFSGGEPFLHLDLLQSLFRHVAHRCGYKMSVSTNAFWARTENTAGAILEELVDWGLWSLLISIDDFHLEYVDAARIENCVNAAVKLGVKCYLQCIETRTSRKLDYYRQKLKISSDPACVDWKAIPCDPVGRAQRQIACDDLLLSWTVRPGTCSMLRVWIVDPEGWVTACCGTASSPLLRVGNVFEEDLADVVHRANVNPLLNALAAWGGPFLLIELLRRKGYGRYAEARYTSPCHACHRLFQDRHGIDLVTAALAERQLELLMSRLIAQQQIYAAGP
ncbi:MAG: radical SAM protein, partial [Desulfobacterales bacterium]